ncbi:YitT family protein [Lederbergia lenta]|uniref:Putative membrane protein, YitT family n=1 Tax=Lederbergia lenta TaxID=1467 RepID=A0A2X4Z0C1_LEDLE|nr:YitT family protein [Lederbergia lenta]MCM3109437.1 YitT family protein [Lederbergia lenta]MEC2324798.1 YitT family protein [Lederbergia lenta]SQI57625.1 putative membrane protein, YitT family [Lederbergia lenta]
MDIPQQITPQIKHKSLPRKILFWRIALITLGAVLMAVALELFLVPNNILDGGITGISIILAHLTGWRLGFIIFILNIPFIYLGYKQIGKTFAFTTFYGIFILSIASIFLHDAIVVTDDLLLDTVFGGIVLGIGVGIVIRYGGSLDGTEVLSILLSNKLPFSVGEVIMFFNFFIFATAGFIFSWERAMYSIITYFVAFKVIDIVIEGLDESKSAWIISEHADEIGNAILARLGRGVTYLKGEGAYTGDDKKVIFCVITRLEEAKLKSIIEELDDSAFLAVSNIAEVRGGRFRKKHIH